ncbi:MAG TPA: hypothetical protein VLM85_22345, partial [Polyangiaceae bacterium]|nr:hypothetical protein [Polyangiaceae bacterium]
QPRPDDRPMKKRALLLSLFLPVCVVVSCQQAPFPEVVTGDHIVVHLTSGNPGDPNNRQTIDFNPSTPYTFHVQVQRPDGSTDTDFNSYLRLSAKPGTVYTGRNLLMQNGEADATVTLVAAFGDTRLWAEDVGYVPVSDLTRQPPPACADGIDNDGDGLVDYPADPGCFSANDDTEQAGTLAAGVSETLYYALPRIADVRGVAVTSGTGTPFPKEQLLIDTGFDPTKPPLQQFAFDVVVTRIASDGFYVTDVQDQQNRGYASVYAFTFSSPQKIGVCDRLRSLTGTASDFFGFTELGFPTWSVEYWDPNVRPCLVPEPYVFTIADLGTKPTMFRYESALVRLLADTSTGLTLRIGSKFGPGKPNPPSALTADATDCDLNGSGKIDYSDPDEAACANACQADIECTEFQNFLSNGGFTIVVSDGTNNAKAQGNATAATTFDPVSYRDTNIKAFTGTLRYFSGGSQFTIEARCDADIVTDLNAQPLSSSQSCVNANGNNPDNQQ